MRSNELVIGIDGGGSKTVAWLAAADGGEVIGRGAAGPSNPQALGFEAACRSLDRAIDTAFADAGLPRGRVASACLALAGADRESDRRYLESWAKTCDLAGTFQVVHDALPILAAGTPAGWGVALIAGTGSLAFGRNAAGRSARAGGWGYLFGDEGSGYAIAVAGLRAAAQAADGRGPATELLGRLLSVWNLNDPSELIAAVYQGPADRPFLAALAEHVLQAADRGDAVAQRIAAQAAADLATMVETLVRKLQLNAVFPLALAGGVLLHASLLKTALLEALSRNGLLPDPICTVPEPVAGAVVLARGVLRDE